MCFNTKPVHTEQHAGFTIQIWHDEDAQNPVKDRDIAGEYTILENRDYRETSNVKNPYTWESLWHDCEAGKLNDHVLFTFFIDSRGGLSFSRPSPAEIVDRKNFHGVWLISPEEIAKEWGTAPTVLPEGTFTPKEMAERFGRAILKDMDDYYAGNCYGFKIVDSDGEEVEDGSCWGFIGDYDEKGGCLDEAKSIAEHEAKRRKEAQDFAAVFMCC